MRASQAGAPGDIRLADRYPHKQALSLRYGGRSIWARTDTVAEIRDIVITSRLAKGP